MQAETYLIQEREVACIKSFGFLFEEQLKILQITIKNIKKMTCSIEDLQHALLAIHLSLLKQVNSNIKQTTKNCTL